MYSYYPVNSCFGILVAWLETTAGYTENHGAILTECTGFLRKITHGNITFLVPHREIRWYYDLYEDEKEGSTILGDGRISLLVYIDVEDLSKI